MSDFKIEFNVIKGDEITNRVIERLKNELESLKEYFQLSTEVLTLNIIQCTDGSRWGRMCCGELGVGWIVLEIKWRLIDEYQSVLVEGASKLHHSGGIGCADIMEKDFGENSLLNSLAPKLAEEIKAKILSSI